MQAGAALQVARLGTLAAATGVDLGPVVATLSAAEPLLAAPLTVALRGDGGALAVTVELPDVDRAVPLVAPIEAGARAGHPLTTLLAALPGTSRELEVRSDGAIAVRVIGERSEDADLATIVALGIPQATRAAMSRAMVRFPVTTPARGAAAVRIAGATIEVELGRMVASTAPHLDESLAAIDALAAAANATRPQRDLIAKVHALLGRGHASIASIAANAHGMIPRLVIRYAGMPWEPALRFITGLHGADAASRLGTFAGTAGGEHVAWLEVLLGPTEPPVVWIATPQVRAK